MEILGKIEGVFRFSKTQSRRKWILNWGTLNIAIFWKKGKTKYILFQILFKLPKNSWGAKNQKEFSALGGAPSITSHGVQDM